MIHLAINGFGIMACVSTSMSPVKNQTNMSRNTTASTKISLKGKKARRDGD